METILHYRILEFIFLGITVLFWVLFFVFGILQAIIQNSTSIFQGLIEGAFTLGGLAIAAAALASQDDRKLFVLPSVLFLASGFGMFANLLVAEYVTLLSTSAITTQPVLSYSFDFFGLLGALGTFGFFYGLGLSITNLLKWYYKPQMK